MSYFVNTPTDPSLIGRIRAELPSLISGKRLEHTYSVEKEALWIADFFLSSGASGTSAHDVKACTDTAFTENDVSAAALLHDCTKQRTDEEQRTLCAHYGVPVNAFTSSAVLHAFTGAHFAREKYAVNDAVFSAIFRHTTGGEEMSLLDKILFVADYTEPLRTYETCRAARDFLHGSLKHGSPGNVNVLNRTVLMSLDDTLKHLVDTRRLIDPATLNARNNILSQILSNSNEVSENVPQK